MPRAETNLRTVIGQNPDGLPLVEALPILRDISAGLAQLAAASVVHRDLKPANILRHDNRWVIADFGIARHAATATSTHTHKSQFTPHYTALSSGATNEPPSRPTSTHLARQHTNYSRAGDHSTTTNTTMRNSVTHTANTRCVSIAPRHCCSSGSSSASPSRQRAALPQAASSPT